MSYDIHLDDQYGHMQLVDRETVTLSRHQGYTVPKGVMHRTRAPERTAILMVEPAGVVPTGD
jgi:mannose-6-phosphate isomerase-like protein (cupin superfamily)